jgi:hypothetical protein
MNRPATDWVASFVGVETILSGTVLRGGEALSRSQSLDGGNRSCRECDGGMSCTALHTAGECYADGKPFLGLDERKEYFPRDNTEHHPVGVLPQGSV